MGRTWLVGVLLAYGALAHDHPYPHIDEVLDHGQAASLGVTIDKTALRTGPTVEFVELSVSFPPMITGRRLRHGGIVAEACETEDLEPVLRKDTDGAWQRYVIRKIVDATCINEIMIFGIYGAPGSSVYYQIWHEPRIKTSKLGR